MKKPKTINLTLKQDAKESSLKPLGGGNADQWNRRLNDLTINALIAAGPSTVVASGRPSNESKK
jgi:hypothetical protein